MFHLFQGTGLRLWWTGQPVVDNPVELVSTVATVPAQLANRVTLDEPLLKPDPLSFVFVVPPLPMKRSLALIAEPSLPAPSIVTIPFDGETEAARTVFFWGTVSILILVN